MRQNFHTHTRLDSIAVAANLHSWLQVTRRTMIAQISTNLDFDSDKSLAQKLGGGSVLIMGTGSASLGANSCFFTKTPCRILNKTFP
mmetsp:Transcript_3562/g.10462  ORF Transcript_3562/g.10462 Transcript_3562/m.10462 type:complete len:87 (-) Transcript_3562:123-383(-)